MMTPQEVGSRSFAKATLGGYNLAQVDEFLDALTEDYTALYNENAILKNKLKVLSETVEEYRATDNAMRKTLLAAQQMADAMVEDAKKKQAELADEAERDAQRRMDELNAAIAAEEYRLRQAQESTAAYVRKLADFHEQEMKFLASLGNLVPPEQLVIQADDPSSDIKAAVAAQVLPEEPQTAQAQPEEPQAPVVSDMTAVYTPVVGPGAQPDDLELDPDATRRFSDMQFGKDYKIE